MFNFFSAVALCLILAPQIFGQSYSDDYSLEQMIQSFFNGTSNAFGRVLLSEEVTGPIEQEVTFFCKNSQTNQLIQTFVNDPNMTTKIDVSKPVYFLTHGWRSSINDSWAQSLLNDMVSFLDVNACGVDWKNLANYEYTIVATQNVPMVGNYATEFVAKVNSIGVALDDITLVGHSFGAHVFGLVGMNINELLNDKVGVIVGCDSANPLFCSPVLQPLSKRLDSTDAKFVQVIHTTDGTVGCAIDHGHQDFRPDGGVLVQKACLIPFSNQTIGDDPVTCSHYQSVVFYHYSLNSSNVFTGRQCACYSDFLLNDCSNVTDVIGPYTKQRPGRFYLETSLMAPFTPNESSDPSI